MSTDGPSGCLPLRRQTHLSVVTFNIHSARTQDGTLDLASIADALIEWHPDVVLLQEVDRGRRWTRRVDMPAILAHRLDMAWVFGVNVRRSAANEYGTAILSRYPILHARNLPLPAPPGTQQRGLLHATIDDGGLVLSVYGTHLENTSSAARLQQIRTIEPILAADPRPVIFGGDLNANPTSRVVATTRSGLTDTWRSVGRGPGATVPGQAPRTRIDYLLYRGGPGIEIDPLRARVLPRVVSDHLAVQATYRMSTGTGRMCVPGHHV
jgi:endonuclease/exonuclease/phosphatase family metal-dependent hydrolase